MSRSDPADRRSDADRRGRFRAYLHRFFTSWVVDDPDPSYSALDREDGLGQVPDPVCEPKVQLPESHEVSRHMRGDEREHSDSNAHGNSEARKDDDARSDDRTQSPVGIPSAR